MTGRRPHRPAPPPHRPASPSHTESYRRTPKRELSPWEHGVAVALAVLFFVVLVPLALLFAWALFRGLLVLVTS